MNLICIKIISVFLVTFLNTIYRKLKYIILKSINNLLIKLENN